MHLFEFSFLFLGNEAAVLRWEELSDGSASIIYASDNNIVIV